MRAQTVAHTHTQAQQWKLSYHRTVVLTQRKPSVAFCSFYQCDALRASTPQCTWACSSLVPVCMQTSNVPDPASVSLHFPYLLFLIQWVARWVRATDWCVNRLCEIASIWRLGDAKQGLLIAAGDSSCKVVDDKSLSLSSFFNALYFILKYYFPTTSTSCIWTQVSVLFSQTGSSPFRLRTIIHNFFILNHWERWHHQDWYTDLTIRMRRTRLLDQENRRGCTASHSSSVAINS